MKDKKRKGYMGGGRNPYRYGGPSNQNINLVKCQNVCLNNYES